MLHFRYTSLRWIITTTRLPDIPLSSFQGGQRLIRQRSLYCLSSYQHKYEQLFIEMLSLLENLLMEDGGYMRGW